MKITLLGGRKLEGRKLGDRRLGDEKFKSTLNVILQLQFSIDYHELWHTTSSLGGRLSKKMFTLSGPWQRAARNDSKVGCQIFWEIPVSFL